MADRPCGCGARGRHKPTCALANTVAVKEKTVVQARTCECSTRGRHSKNCITLQVDDIEEPITNDPNVYMLYLHEKYYGKIPHLSWVFNKDRQVTTEKRIASLLKKNKPLHLQVVTVDGQKEDWYIDSGNHVSLKNEDGKYKDLIGNAYNVLPFLTKRVTVWELVAGRKFKRKKK